ncbi:hypothetical protein [Hyphomicrobium sp.]|uniref:hypothetical protein n=1 Tax=Hyphomicrobium sp. TaxID=82 RepID=UPI002E2F1EA2|nr:hypothetical protein [Hyphomicrobium sp.]HEX2842105.1 hypothetical protein [Hyphomicrobium sp.]
MRSIFALTLLLAALFTGQGLAQQNRVLQSIHASGMRLGTGLTSPTTEKVRITQAGNIGIGTSAPGKTLEVAGTLSATTVYSYGSLHIIPVGIILPWHKSMTGVPNLPPEWLECNGQTISDVASPMNGQAVPDLNNQVYAGGRGYYLRGGTTSGVFNDSSYFSGNGSKYNFGSSTNTYYGVNYGRVVDGEAGSTLTYNATDNNLQTNRFQVAAMTMVYIIKIK